MKGPMKIIIDLLRKYVLVLLMLSLPHFAYAWGERGHNIIGYTAAQLTANLTTPEEQKKLGSYFTSRTYVLGHLSNIPDISWKDRRSPTIASVNSANHYFDTEIILGKYDKKDSAAYLEKIRNLEPDLDKFLAQYEGKPSPLDSSSNIKVADEVGSAPFRADQLYSKMVEAFKCAKQKEAVTAASAPKQGDEHKVDERPYREPIQNGDYACTPATSRLEDLGAAIETGGVMGHFVGDLGQPYHTTVDHDGYAIGQGGIHGYFETFLLTNIDDKLLADVRAKTLDKAFQKNVWQKQMKLQAKDEPRTAALMFHLIADSFSQIEKAAEIDRKNVVTKMGEVVDVTDKKLHKYKGRSAERRADDDPVALKAFRQFIVDRLATSSYLLSSLWIRAWREAGSPDVHDVHLIAIPYPLDPPFILPAKPLYQEKAEKLKAEMAKK
jgi:hypothetical protein